METIVGKYFFHAFRTTGIFAGIFHKIDFTFGRQTKHFSVCILSGSRTSRSNHIKNGSNQRRTEHPCIFIPFCQGRELAVEQFVADTCQCHTLSGITEYLGRRKHQDIIIRISCHSGRIRRFERMPHIPTEVHAEISQIFHDNHIIPGCQFTDYLQFLLFQTNPCRIIRIRIDNRCYIAFTQETFQFLTQGLSPIMIDIKLFPLHADNAKLGFLNRKSGINEQYLVFPRNTLRTGYERAE